MNNRAGHYKSNLSGKIAYQSFVPNPLPPDPPLPMKHIWIFCAKELEFPVDAAGSGKI